jgi:pyruvate dehydrogenase complex dehydrogenase (E1) component
LTLPASRRKLAAMASRKKQLSRAEIHALRDKFKLNLGDKSFAEWMADLNREEKELEERKYRRLAAMGKVGK